MEESAVLRPARAGGSEARDDEHHPRLRPAGVRAEHWTIRQIVSGRTTIRDPSVASSRRPREDAPAGIDHERTMVSGTPEAVVAEARAAIEAPRARASPDRGAPFGRGAGTKLRRRKGGPMLACA